MSKCQNINKSLSKRRHHLSAIISSGLIVSLVIVLFGSVVELGPATSPAASRSICDLGRSIVYCNCDEEPAHTVTCFTLESNATADDPVWDLFKTQAEVTVFSLKAYQNTTFNFLPLKAVNYIRNTLQNLQFSQINVGKLQIGTLQDMPALEAVDFSICNISDAEVNSFQSLHHLTKFVMNKNNLTVLRDLFEDVPRLTDLYLEDNSIQRIEIGAFSALTSLIYLALDRNQIEKIDQKTFIGLRNLESIEIARNRLTTLPAYLFVEMPKLDRIDLGYNQISSIDENAFSGLTNLQDLKLEHNRLQNFPGAAVFSKNPNLILLDIAFNDFEHLSRQVFYQPQNDRFIRMRIKGNKLQCTCSLAWLEDALKSFDSIEKKQLETIDCYYPKDTTSEPPKPQSLLKYIISDRTAQLCAKTRKLLDIPLPPIEPDHSHSEGHSEIELIDELPNQPSSNENLKQKKEFILNGPIDDKTKPNENEPENSLSKASFSDPNGSNSIYRVPMSFLIFVTIFLKLYIF